MARKRGRSNTKQTVVEKREGRDPIVNSTQDNSVSFGLPDREAMYALADKENYGIEPEESTQEELAEEDVVTNAIEETTDTTLEEVDETEVSTDNETMEFVAETTEEKAEADEKAEVETVSPVEDIKTVPLSALHESRNKEKELRLRAEEAEKKLAALQSEPEVNVEDPYEDEATAALRKRLDAFEQKEREREIETQKLSLDSQIKQVHDNLIVKGIDGFSTIGRSYVMGKFMEMNGTDPEWVQAHDNPEGWEKLYLEALPALQAIGQRQHKADLFNAKKEAKKGAGLITTTGKKPADDAQPEQKLSEREQYLLERSQLRL